MAKYLKQDGGKIKEVIATTSSNGVANAGDIIALDATGRINKNMMPAGIVPLTKTLPASENLSAGDYVNIFDDGGTLSVRKADANSADKQADGYVLDAVVITTSVDALVYFEDFNNQISGKTPGAIQYLSTTPGATQETAPTGAGKIVQILGKAVSATEMTVEIEQPIELAS